MSLLNNRHTEEFEIVVVKNWVEFWRWQSKVIEKRCQERNLAVQRRLLV
jgi:hypothetical protein